MMPASCRSDEANTNDWQKLDRDHYLHPFTNYKALAESGSRIITRGNGVYIWDSDGNRILDGMSGLWCVNIGYGRKELVDAANAQLEKLPYYNSFFNTATPPSIELAQLLAEVTPAGFSHSFFTGSGSESIDTMLRIVRRYWQIAGQPDKRNIIGRKRAYHGSTIAGVNLGGMKKMHEQGSMPMPDFHHIVEPDWYRNGGGVSRHEFGVVAAKQLESKILELGPANVAAFVGEPIQGAGGVIISPDTYWPEINRICGEYDVLLVADEVITGFGRTGEWFGSDYFHIEADLMTVAKGLSSGYLPIGAVMVSDRVADVLTESPDDFTHGFTYSGHPVCCAVAIENIRILIREEIIEQVKERTAKYFAQRWSELGASPIVGEARSVGLIAALELVRDKQSGTCFEEDDKVGQYCRDLCITNGLMIRAIGDTLVAAPPLIISENEIDEMVDCIRSSLDVTARHHA
jgi:putrescine aminotransferase